MLKKTILKHMLKKILAYSFSHQTDAFTHIKQKIDEARPLLKAFKHLIKALNENKYNSESMANLARCALSHLKAFRENNKNLKLWPKIALALPKILVKKLNPSSKEDIDTLSMHNMLVTCVSALELTARLSDFKTKKDALTGKSNIHLFELHQATSSLIKLIEIDDVEIEELKELYNLLYKEPLNFDKNLNEYLDEKLDGSLDGIEALDIKNIENLDDLNKLHKHLEQVTHHCHVKPIKKALTGIAIDVMVGKGISPETRDLIHNTTLEPVDNAMPESVKNEIQSLFTSLHPDTSVPSLQNQWKKIVVTVLGLNVHPHIVSVFFSHGPHGQDLNHMVAQIKPESIRDQLSALIQHIRQKAEGKRDALQRSYRVAERHIGELAQEFSRPDIDWTTIDVPRVTKAIKTCHEKFNAACSVGISRRSHAHKTTILDAFYGVSRNVSLQKRVSEAVEEKIQVILTEIAAAVTAAGGHVLPDFTNNVHTVNCVEKMIYNQLPGALPEDLDDPHQVAGEASIQAHADLVRSRFNDPDWLLNVTLTFFKETSGFAPVSGKLFSALDAMSVSALLPTPPDINGSTTLRSIESSIKTLSVERFTETFTNNKEVLCGVDARIGGHGLLGLAARFGRWDIFEFLRSKGFIPAPLKKDENDFTLFHYTALGGNKDLWQFLSHDVKPTEYKQLLDESAISTHTPTLISLWCESGNIWPDDILEDCGKAKAKTMLTSYDSTGNSAISRAVMGGNLQALKLAEDVLTEAELLAQLNHENNFGQPALVLAISFAKCPETVSYLLEKGVSIPVTTADIPFTKFMLMEGTDAVKAVFLNNFLDFELEAKNRMLVSLREDPIGLIQVLKDYIDPQKVATILQTPIPGYYTILAYEMVFTDADKFFLDLIIPLGKQYPSIWSIKAESTDEVHIINYNLFEYLPGSVEGLNYYFKEESYHYFSQVMTLSQGVIPRIIFDGPPEQLVTNLQALDTYVMRWMLENPETLINGLANLRPFPRDKFIDLLNVLPKNLAARLLISPNLEGVQVISQYTFNAYLYETLVDGDTTKWEELLNRLFPDMDAVKAWVQEINNIKPITHKNIQHWLNYAPNFGCLVMATVHPKKSISDLASTPSNAKSLINITLQCKAPFAFKLIFNSLPEKKRHTFLFHPCFKADLPESEWPTLLEEIAKMDPSYGISQLKSPDVLKGVATFGENHSFFKTMSNSNVLNSNVLKGWITDDATSFTNFLRHIGWQNAHPILSININPKTRRSARSIAEYLSKANRETFVNYACSLNAQELKQCLDIGGDNRFRNFLSDRANWQSSAPWDPSFAPFWEILNKVSIDHRVAVISSTGHAFATSSDREFGANYPSEIIRILSTFSANLIAQTLFQTRGTRCFYVPLKIGAEIWTNSINDEMARTYPGVDLERFRDRSWQHFIHQHFSSFILPTDIDHTAILRQAFNNYGESNKSGKSITTINYDFFNHNLTTGFLLFQLFPPSQVLAMLKKRSKKSEPTMLSQLMASYTSCGSTQKARIMLNLLKFLGNHMTEFLQTKLSEYRTVAEAIEFNLKEQNLLAVHINKSSRVVDALIDQDPKYVFKALRQQETAFVFDLLSKPTALNDASGAKADEKADDESADAKEAPGGAFEAKTASKLSDAKAVARVASGAKTLDDDSEAKTASKLSDAKAVARVASGAKTLDDDSETKTACEEAGDETTDELKDCLFHKLSRDKKNGKRLLKYLTERTISASESASSSSGKKTSTAWAVEDIAASKLTGDSAASKPVASSSGAKSAGSKLADSKAAGSKAAGEKATIIREIEISFDVDAMSIQGPDGTTVAANLISNQRKLFLKYLSKLPDSDAQKILDLTYDQTMTIREYIDSTADDSGQCNVM